MELVKSLTVDSAPAATQLFRFALITCLETIKKILLIFPVNIAIFLIIIIISFYKIAKMITPKQKFNQKYTPLRHNETGSQQIKALKKQLRQVQGDLIQILKKSKKNQEGLSQLNSNNHHQSEKDSQVNSQISSCILEGKEKIEMLEMIQQQLKKTVVAAYSQVAKIKNM